jgi:hypothetical protein
MVCQWRSGLVFGKSPVRFLYELPTVLSWGYLYELPTVLTWGYLYELPTVLTWGYLYELPTVLSWGYLYELPTVLTWGYLYELPTVLSWGYLYELPTVLTWGYLYELPTVLSWGYLLLWRVLHVSTSTVATLKQTMISFNQILTYSSLIIIFPYHPMLHNVWSWNIIINDIRINY